MRQYGRSGGSFDLFFENADILVLRNFDSEELVGVITEKKAIQVERKNWRGIEGSSLIPKRRWSRLTWGLYYNMETIICDIAEKCS